MEIGVNEFEFAVYAYSILVLDFQPTHCFLNLRLHFFRKLCRLKILMEATLLVGFLSVISASIVDKKTLIALCIISGPSSNSQLLMSAIKWLILELFK